MTGTERFDKAQHKPVVWLDLDTGVDDTSALSCAVSLEKRGLLSICGVSAVCGNTTQRNAFRNTRNVLGLLGREDIRVFPGAEKPLLCELRTAAYVHGENGLGGVILKESAAPAETTKAWDALYQTALRFEGELELILTGPHTNAAIAFAKYPELKKLIRRILIMGGAEVGGNIRPAAEFNIWEDPDAAQVIFKSGVPVVMCGLDVTEKGIITPEEIQEIDKGETVGCCLFRETTRHSRPWYARMGINGLHVHDVCPVVYTVFPELFRGEPAGVFVETRGFITKGKTVCDRDTDVKFGVKNTMVVLDMDRDRFAKLFMELLRETGPAAGGITQS